MRVWRLCQAAHSKKVLTREGGLYAHGRWHLQGVRVMYAAARTAVLEVPSAVIARECNYLLNPAHPHFARVRVIARSPFFFDSRLPT